MRLTFPHLMVEINSINKLADLFYVLGGVDDDDCVDLVRLWLDPFASENETKVFNFRFSPMVFLGSDLHVHLTELVDDNVNVMEMVLK